MNSETAAQPTLGRRLQLRYVCDLLTRCAKTDSPTVTALAVDVSRTGVCLLVSQPFERGTIVELDLPLAGEVVCACVLHASPVSGGWWKIGCSFTETLREECLASLWKMAPDRRSHERFPADFRATYEGDQCRGIATVTDISRRGLCLLLDHPFPVGTSLRLQLRGDVVMDKSACVARVTQQEDGIWACGCTFVQELTDSQIEQFVEHGK
jgi:hypothetical protein